MNLTEAAIRLLQRALNALARDPAPRQLAIDGRFGPRTRAALIRHLAAHGREGEAALARALAALR